MVRRVCSIHQKKGPDVDLWVQSSQPTIYEMYLVDHRDAVLRVLHHPGSPVIKLLDNTSLGKGSVVRAVRNTDNLQFGVLYRVEELQRDDSDNIEVRRLNDDTLFDIHISEVRVSCVHARYSLLMESHIILYTKTMRGINRPSSITENVQCLSWDAPTVVAYTPPTMLWIVWVIL